MEARRERRGDGEGKGEKGEERDGGGGEWRSAAHRAVAQQREQSKATRGSAVSAVSAPKRFPKVCVVMPRLRPGRRRLRAPSHWPSRAHTACHRICMPDTHRCGGRPALGQCFGRRLRGGGAYITERGRRLGDLSQEGAVARGVDEAAGVALEHRRPEEGEVPRFCWGAPEPQPGALEPLPRNARRTDP